MTATTTPLMTAEDLFNMPDDGYRYELVDGLLIRMSRTGFRHLQVVGALIHLLRAFVVEHNLGVVGGEGGFIFRRKPDRVFAPDVVFVRADRLPPEDQREGFFELIPDLAAEVLSPSDTALAVNRKVLIYLKAGVCLVWVVDPRQWLVRVWTPDRAVRVLTEGNELDGGDVLPGFRPHVAELFR